MLDAVRLDCCAAATHSGGVWQAERRFTVASRIVHDRRVRYHSRGLAAFASWNTPAGRADSTIIRAHRRAVGGKGDPANSGNRPIARRLHHRTPGLMLVAANTLLSLSDFELPVPRCQKVAARHPSGRHLVGRCAVQLQDAKEARVTAQREI